jgi:hypothetical protein
MIAFVLFWFILMPFLWTTKPRKSPGSSDEFTPQQPFDLFLDFGHNFWCKPPWQLFHWFLSCLDW